jgi:hypothetical protein
MVAIIPSVQHFSIKEFFMQSRAFPRRLPGVASYIALTCMLSAAASAADIVVPQSLQPAAAQTLVIEAHAAGAQVYTCSASAPGVAPAWVLKAPDAILYDAAGAKLATHYVGPTWEAADGSKVVGKVKASAPSPTDGIPWLLLDVKSTQGSGVFAHISAVQRLATEGGKAPADGCGAASLGQETRVPYKAVYRFYTGKNAG